MPPTPPTRPWSARTHPPDRKDHNGIRSVLRHYKGLFGASRSHPVTERFNLFQFMNSFISIHGWKMVVTAPRTGVRPTLSLPGDFGLFFYLGLPFRHNGMSASSCRDLGLYISFILYPLQHGLWQHPTNIQPSRLFAPPSTISWVSDSLPETGCNPVAAAMQ